MKWVEGGIIVIGGVGLGAVMGAAFWPPALWIVLAALALLALLGALVARSDDGG